MVKVGFLSTALRNIGGVEQWMMNMARHCDKDRVKWTGTVVTVPVNDDDYSVREMRMHMPVYDAKQLMDGMKVIGETSDIIISSIYSGLGSLANKYRFNNGVKVVVVSHGDIPGLCEFARGDGDHLVAVSEPARNGLWPDMRPIKIIHLGVDINRIVPISGRQSFREKHNIAMSDIVLTYIGRFSEEKNHLVALKTALSMGKHFKALYVGSTSWPTGGADLAAAELTAMGGNQICCLPTMRNIGDVLAASDVIINASPAEGFCLTIVEGWLAHVPVISTNTGIVKELQPKYGPLVYPITADATTNTVATAVVTAMSQHWKLVTDKAYSVAWNHLTATASAANWTEYLEGIKGFDYHI